MQPKSNQVTKTMLNTSNKLNHISTTKTTSYRIKKTKQNKNKPGSISRQRHDDDDDDDDDRKIIIICVFLFFRVVKIWGYYIYIFFISCKQRFVSFFHLPSKAKVNEIGVMICHDVIYVINL